MIIIDKLENLNIEDTAIALGNFDGVHLGHQEIIKKTVSYAKEKGLKAAVFTFKNHPRNLIPGKKEVKNIIYSDEKAKLIESLGVDYLFDIEFTDKIMKMEPEEYIYSLLLSNFKAKAIFSGFNYRFGYMAKGDIVLLKELGEKYNFYVDISNPVIIDDEVVSSTLIRQLIKSGDIDECYKFLGRNYSTRGKVVVGNKLGKSIGFPTSNIMIDESMVTPPNGVYITYLKYNGNTYPSITNVGVKPTIGEFKKNMETHIFNFDSELYGKDVEIEFIEMMRPEAKFTSLDELVDQIRKDCEKAKEYHNIL